MIWRNLSRLLLAGLLLICIGVVWLACTESGLVWGVERLEAYLRSEGLQVDQVRGTLVTQVTLQGLLIRAQGVEVAMDELRLTLRPGRFLAGELNLQDLRGQGVRVSYVPLAPGQPGQVGQLEQGDGQEEESHGLMDIVLPMALQVDRLELLNVVISGGTDEEELVLERLSATLAVQGSHLDVTELSLVHETWQLVVGGELDLQGDWPSDIRASFSLSDGFLGDLAGTFQLHGPFLDLELMADLSAPVPLQIHGHIRNLLQTPDWQLELSWQEQEMGFLWPRLAEFSAAGNLTLAGQWSDFQGTLQGQLHHVDGLVIPVRAELSGHEKGLVVREISWDLPGGTGPVQGQGEMGWEQGFVWQAKLSGADLAPEGLFPAWPGRLGLDLVSNGSWQDGQLRFDLDLQRVEGELRGYPLHMSGQVRFEQEQWQLSGLRLSSGENRIQVNGTLAQNLDVMVEAHCPQLEALLPEGLGQLDFSGRVNGPLGQLLLEADIAGSDLAYQGQQLAALNGSVRLDLSGSGELTGAVTAGRWQSGSLVVLGSHLELAGSRADHELQIQIEQENDRLTAVVRGHLEDMAWQGGLDQMSLSGTTLGDWQLSKPSALKIVGSGFSMAPLCLVLEHRDEVCLEGAGDFSGTGQLLARLTDVDLELVKTFTTQLDSLTGHIKGTIRAATDQGSLRSLTGKLRIPDLALMDFQKLSPRPLLNLAENEVAFDYDGKRLEARMGVGDSGQGRIQARAMLVDLDGPAAFLQAPLSGRVEMNLPDVAVFEPLTHGLFLPAGRLGGGFDLGGSLAAPEFHGRLDLLDGQVQIPAAGITLEDLKCALESRGPWLHLSLTATSGAGQLEIKGRGRRDAQQGWLVQGEMNGRELLILNIPEYRLVADPDLRFDYADRLGTFRGQVQVVEGEIILLSHEDGLSLSPDVVVINGDHLPLAVGRDPQFSGRITLGLGDAVRFEGFGLSGLLKGGLDVDFAGNRELTGRGSLSLDQGQFAFKGRALDISRGRISYFETPLSNPAVDIRARRLTEEGEVGVLVSGTLEEMEYSLFSDPAMNERDILAQILAGTVSFGEEDEEGILQQAASTLGLRQGLSLLSELQQGFALDNLALVSDGDSSPMSLVVGSRLAPDLYLSYGYDLFNATGLFRARYELGHGFSVVTEVNTLSSGTDLLWSVEH